MSIFIFQLQHADNDGPDGQPLHELQLIQQHDGLPPLLHVSAPSLPHLGDS